MINTTYSDIVDDIKLVSETSKLTPTQLNWALYKKFGGKYTERQIRSAGGGLTSIITAEFGADGTTDFILQPVEIKVKPLVSKVKKGSSLNTCIVLPDIQAGFKKDFRTGALQPTHDRKALDVAISAIKYTKPDRVVLLGDNLDLPDWSKKFLRSPEFYFATQPTLVELAWWLAQVRLAAGKDAQIDYIEGNHEKRLLVAILSDVAPMYDLRPANELQKSPIYSIERLLGLDDLDINYHGPYPTGEVWLNRNLNLHHGIIARARSGATVSALVEDARHSQGQGHVHRIELASKTGWTSNGPKTYTAFSPGTLCSIEPGVVPGAKFRQNWQQGIAKIEYETSGREFFQINLIPINDGRAILDGRILEASEEADIVAKIEKDCDYKVS